MLNDWPERDRHERRCVGERARECRIPLEQCTPERLSIAGVRGLQRRDAPWREQETRAGHSVVETERVHPAFIDHMVHGGPIIRVRTLRHSWYDVLHQLNAIEVAEDERGTGLSALETRRNRELSCEKTVWTRRVDEEIRTQLERGAVSAAGDAHGIRCDIRLRQFHAIAIVNARGDGLAHKMVIHVGA